MKKILGLMLTVASVSYSFAGNTYIDGNIGVFNPPTSFYSASVGLNANIGYMFNPYFGLEGGLTYSPLNVAENTSAVNVTSDYFGLDVAVKGLLPLSRSFGLYGKLGLSENWYNSTVSVGGLSASASGDSTGGLVGVGAQFNLTRNWSMHLENDYTFLFSPDGISNPNLAMLGVEYKF